MISCRIPHGASSSHQADNECYQHLIAHYSARGNRTVEQREASPIIHLKKLHDWIKDVLVGMYAKKGDAVLDMACGKGADIAKWCKAKVKLYVGVDIVESSLHQARKRFQELDMRATKQGPHHTTSSNGFSAKFICVDCFNQALGAHVAMHVPKQHSFDICACQFALHYSWSTVARARATLANVAALLKPGGYFIGTIPDADVILAKLRQSSNGEFGNRLYRVKFDKHHHAKALRCAKEPYGVKYEFFLEDAVDHCPEWLVPFNELRNLAKLYGLELVMRKNFHDFVKEQMQGSEVVELMRKQDIGHGPISHEEWECVSLYLVFAFRKRSLV